VLGDRIVEVQGLAVARFDLDAPDSVEWAAAGTGDGTTPVGPDTPFETGSVMKVITGMLLADMVERGETSLDRTLTEILPDLDFADPEVASITLRELATHHSGLRAVPDGDEAGVALRSSLLIGPYEGATPPLEGLAHTQAGPKDRYVYSNHAFATLGHALAAEAGDTYPELVRERILDPLGMDDTAVTAERPDGGALSYHEPGVRVAPWGNTDYAPAGVATWSTVSDLVTLVRAVADGTAPGADATDVVLEDVRVDGAPSDDEPAGEGGDAAALSLGLAWHILDTPDHGKVTFHNGQVYGSSTTVLFDDERALVLMGNSFSLQETELALGLLGEEPGGPLSAPPTTALFGALTLLPLVVPPALLLALVLRRRTLITQRPLDRLRLVSLGLGALAWLVYAQRGGVWTDLPTELFGVAAGAVGAALTVGVWHWSRVPTEAGRFRWLHVTVFVLSVLFSLTLLSLMGYGLVVAHR
ncbi:serine hydrolase, partial [Nocardiopsis sp. MG754419]|uniref:serine hydrolase domain-containing protein n=1 Tax=Nocardiopsis sp. MG754419 TaxID=2259865 RepID=UPI001BADBE1A